MRPYLAVARRRAVAEPRGERKTIMRGGGERWEKNSNSDRWTMCEVGHEGRGGPSAIAYKHLSSHGPVYNMPQIVSEAVVLG